MATYDTAHYGTYTGTGAEQVIPDIGWKPILILIVDWTAGTFSIKSAGMPGKQFLSLSSAGVSKQSAGVERTDEGFTVWTNDFVNKSGNQYLYMVMQGR